MNPTVQAALISAAVTLFVCLFTNWQQNRKRRIDDAVREAKLELRLQSIEDKLDTHNGYAEKIGSIQQDISYIKGKMAGV